MSESFWCPGIDPGHEPHKVMIAKGVLTDPKREQRQVPYKLYYPVNHTMTGLPLVVWSHGLGGSRDGAAFIARFLAAHGYVVCNIQHPGTDSSLWEGKPGHPWDNIRKAHIPRKASLDRFRDVPFLLDRLDEMGAAHPDAWAHIDCDVIGMSGHSFGAMTTQVIAGQKIPDEDGRLIQIKDERIRAGILYSPVPVRHLTDAPDAEIYGPLARPLFHMTGTDDSSPVEGFDYTLRRLPFDNAGADNQHLLILKDGDHMVYNGSRGKLADNPKRHVHEAIIKIAALAFWDAYLKSDKAAMDWLTGSGFAGWLGDEGEYAYRATS